MTGKRKKQRELAGVKRLLALLPAGQAAELLDCWLEFDAAETAESRFANACDRAMPVLLNLANQGQSWREHGTRFEQVVQRIQAPIHDGAPALWLYLQKRLLAAKADGWFGMTE